MGLKTQLKRRDITKDEAKKQVRKWLEEQPHNRDRLERLISWIDRKKLGKRA